MSTIEILNPEIPDEAPPAGLHPAARHGLGADSRLTLIENGKPRARDLLLMIAERLRERHAVGSVRVISKSSASNVIDDQQVAEIAATSDAVIAGLGDCGACSACSLADAIRMEGAGVPSTVVISDVFSGHVASFAVTMGMPGYHTAVVPHPVSTRSDARLEAYAASVVETILTQLGGVMAAAS